MTHKVTLIPGDGTRPEIVAATRRVVAASGADIDWEVKEAGIPALEQFGNLLPDDTMDSIRRNKVALKGPLTTPIGTGFRSINVALRQLFGLYACLRPCRSYEGVRSRYQNIDIVLVRENLFSGIRMERDG